MSDNKDDYAPPAADLADWRALADKATKGSAESLATQTPEGVTLKPLYTAADTENLPYADTLPGIEPFIRGPQATM